MKAGWSTSGQFRDAGVGFRAQAGDKLFEGFYTTKNDGMGIGLLSAAPLSKLIMDICGRHPMMAQELHFPSPFLAEARVKRLIQQRTRHDLGRCS